MVQGGSVEVVGQTLAGDDLMLKRGFKGDSKVFEAAVSEDGKVMVILDTRKDEKVNVLVAFRTDFIGDVRTSLSIGTNKLCLCWFDFRLRE